MEKEKLIAELDERYLKKEGGKDMPDNEEFVSKKDLEIMELEKARPIWRIFLLSKGSYWMTLSLLDI